MHQSTREFDIIERYFAHLSDADNGAASSRAIVLGPGDDCGIFAVPAGHEVCISTDTLTAGVHFPVDADPAVVAHRALAANLSDLAAMGAEPLTCTLAMTLDARAATDAWLAPFARHLKSQLAQADVPLIGGNLSHGELSLTFTVLGTTPVGQALRRDGAQVGDDVYVTGHPGDAAGGLRQLLAKTPVTEALLQRYEYPQARLAAGVSLRGVASAAIDISDGLLADIGHIAERSGVGLCLLQDQLPLSEPLLQAFDLEQARLLALGGGDDYELAFTAPVSQRSAIADLTQLGLLMTRIGQVEVGQGVRVLDTDGKVVNVAIKGYARDWEKT